MQNEGGVLYADLDLDHDIQGKQYHDVVVRYQRLGVFQLQFSRIRAESVVFTHEGLAKEGQAHWRDMSVVTT